MDHLLRGMLFAVGPADPLVFITVPVALILTAAAAILALRAARVDPMQALRADCAHVAKLSPAFVAQAFRTCEEHRCSAGLQACRVGRT
jgi:hypothetical protein